MDSRDDLRTFEAALEDILPSGNAQTSSSQDSSSEGEDYADALPILEAPSDLEQMPSFVRMAALTSDDVHMLSLMSVSDSSEEQDEFADDDNSEWEDEDDTEFENDLLTFRPFWGIHGSPPLTPPISPHFTNPDLQRPLPRHTQLEEFSDVISGGTRTLNDFRPEPTPIGHVPPEMLERMVMHNIAGREVLRPLGHYLDRAKVLVEGLETVPKGLLVRMARVGGAPGSHEDLSGDEESAVAGCAVCWAALHHETLVETVSGNQQTLPFSSEVGESVKIVSLPCAHVFHSACLLPWFSRPGTTTCPTCRFDIDPDALTWRPPMRLRAQSSGDSSPSPAGNGTPIDDWEDESIDYDEDNEDGLESIDSTAAFDDDIFLNNIFAGGNSRHPEGRVRIPLGTWTLPQAPGKTLRERIIEKEREMGLRCMNSTCVLAPTDEDPHPSVLDTRQISIQATLTSECKHSLHPACLVMSARGAGPHCDNGELSAIELACPCCHTVGIVKKQDWESGVEALALIDC